MTPSCEAEKEDQRYFNSPPHKKNHIATTMINTVFFKISTHILTKRMTDGFPTFCILCVISTHILTKRMTTLQQLVRLSERYFNSHPHEEDDGIYNQSCGLQNYFNSHPHEEDDIIQDFPAPSGNISTHILTKRMTKSLRIYRGGSIYFNSHPHEEDDHVSIIRILHTLIFQLTSSRRG